MSAVASCSCLCDEYENRGGCCCQIGAALALRKRAELLTLLRPCFARAEPRLQAGSTRLRA